jgi:hypothetical protein
LLNRSHDRYSLSGKVLPLFGPRGPTSVKMVSELEKDKP